MRIVSGTLHRRLRLSNRFVDTPEVRMRQAENRPVHRRSRRPFHRLHEVGLGEVRVLGLDQHPADIDHQVGTRQILVHRPAERARRRRATRPSARYT